MLFLVAQFTSGRTSKSQLTSSTFPLFPSPSPIASCLAAATGEFKTPLTLSCVCRFFFLSFAYFRSAFAVSREHSATSCSPITARSTNTSSRKDKKKCVCIVFFSPIAPVCPLQRNKIRQRKVTLVCLSLALPRCSFFFSVFDIFISLGHCSHSSPHYFCVTDKWPGTKNCAIKCVRACNCPEPRVIHTK